MNRTSKEQAKRERDYLRVIKEVLLCNPIPACKRWNDRLEPPWEVIRRIRKERKLALKFLGQTISALDRMDITEGLSPRGHGILCRAEEFFNAIP